MYRVAVTNRHLCEGDFLARIKCLIDFDMVILREKDLSEAEYLSLAQQVIGLHDNVILHSYVEVAHKLDYPKIHLPFDLFRISNLSFFEVVGVSVHSLEEACAAEQGGASYLIYGHVFQTDCKKGVPARGLKELADICKKVNIPVFAIGGISESNEEEVRAVGVAGVCSMSSAMREI